MTPLRRAATAVLVVVLAVVVAAAAAAKPRRILVDTDMDTDDLFALLYLLKQNRSEFELKSMSMADKTFPNKTVHVTTNHVLQQQTSRADSWT
ncbi:hypothetical protein OsJ_18506 [Oryza sativa Japonica Group]|uniref:Inosine/uridine-preferring nucleoside hydrolase domain-containing protein n=1 Tax=Oryza sativa subsp. japonica TaxID=39947 RepID=B9FPJ9_ORYSJ|nr:hypothetical protein OsJ_18506 [Oryza sativa Japonica Group]